MKPTTRKTIDGASRAACLLISGLAVGWLTGLSTSPVVQYVITSLIAVIVSVTSALAGIKFERTNEGEDVGSIKRRPHIQVTPWPVMLLVLGLAVGASLGVLARTNGWLGPDPNRFVQKWKEIGLESREISRRLFDTMYPPTSSGSGTRTDQQIITANDNPHAETPVANNGESGNNKSDTDRKSTANVESSTSVKPSTPASSTLAQQLLAPTLFNFTEHECATFQTENDFNRLKEYLTNNKNQEIAGKAGSCLDKRCLDAIVAAHCKQRRKS